MSKTDNMKIILNEVKAIEMVRLFVEIYFIDVLKVKIAYPITIFIFFSL